MTEKNITFLVPPPLDNNSPAERTAGCTHMVYAMPNIYELTVVAVLEQSGFLVSYQDFVLNKQEASGFTEFTKNDDSCVYCFWSVNLSLATDLLALEEIRKWHAHVPVVFMGPAATYYTKQFLLDDNVYVVRGEPDQVVLNLVQHLLGGLALDDVNGISYKRNGLQINNKAASPIAKLDDLPFPSRKHIQHITYRNPKLKASPYTAVVTSRNCPFHCIYCVPSSLTFARELEYKSYAQKKPPITFRSVENVEAELVQLFEMGYKSIAFVDDNFIWNEARLKGICDVLKKYDFHWGCQARADAITEEVAQILADANCEYIDLGAESFDDEILKYIKKSLTVRDIERAVNILHKYRVPVKLNILIGTSPLETKASIKKTMQRARQLKVSQVMFNIVAPFPGTDFYYTAKEKGWIKGGEYVATDVQRNSILDYPHLSSKEMEKILFWGNLRFFLRPEFIWYHVKRFRSFSDFKSAWNALMIKFFG